MKFLSLTGKTVILFGMILLLLGWRSKTIDITPGQPVGPESPYTTRSDVKIKVYNFQDARQGMLDPHLIGKRKAMGMALGDVSSSRPVFEIVTEAVKSELARQGYKIVPENEDVFIKGKIDQFWAKTPLKMMGAVWEVEGEVTLTLETGRPGQQVRTTLGPYTGRKAERSINATPDMFRRVLTGALMDTMRQMGSDQNLINALSTRQKK
jgi:uncharacterized lipoprotein YajG